MKKVKTFDGNLTDLGSYDGGLYFYAPSLGHTVTMREIFKDFLDASIVVGQQELKTKRKLIFTVKKDNTSETTIIGEDE